MQRSRVQARTDTRQRRCALVCAVGGGAAGVCVQVCWADSAGCSCEPRFMGAHGAALCAADSPKDKCSARGYFGRQPAARCGPHGPGKRSAAREARTWSAASSASRSSSSSGSCSLSQRSHVARSQGSVTWHGPGPKCAQRASARSALRCSARSGRSTRHRCRDVSVSQDIRGKPCAGVGASGRR